MNVHTARPDCFSRIRADAVRAACVDGLMAIVPRASRNELIVNRRIASALGIDVPRALVLRVDDVIR